MNEKTIALKKTARIAGLLYFLLAITAIYGYFFVSPKIMVRGDASATGANMIANEFLFRTGIATGLLSLIFFVFVVMMLYHLFKSVNANHGRIMVGLVLVGIPIGILADGLKITALAIFKGEMLKSFEAQQAQELALAFLRIGSYSSQIITVLWGLWLFPLGLLTYRSGFLPRILGVLLIINGIGYVINSFTFILFPGYQSIVSKFVYPTYFVGEIPFILWLLIKGVKNNRRQTSAA